MEKWTTKYWMQRWKNISTWGKLLVIFILVLFTLIKVVVFGLILKISLWGFVFHRNRSDQSSQTAHQKIKTVLLKEQSPHTDFV